MSIQHILVVDVYNKVAHQSEVFEFWGNSIEIAQERFEKWYKNNQHKYKLLGGRTKTTERG